MNPVVIEALSVLRLQPGDSLVIRCDGRLHAEQVERLKAYVRDVLGPTFTAPILVLDAGMTLEVLREAA